MQTHGFFAIMGGFRLFNDSGPVRTLDPDELQSLAQDGDIDFPGITENEIRDKSKGDVLLKGLVVIQTGWFILQCIARGIEGLPLTGLELVTLCCGKKFLTSRISGPDKYRQVLLGFRMGVYRPMLEKYKIYR